MNLAGKIETCVFDKTGTLTEEHLFLEGIAVETNNEIKMVRDIKNNKSPKFDEFSMILSGCQSIVEIKNELNGDPIELLFFENSDYGFQCGSKKAYYTKNPSKYLTIRRIYYFNSELKRMSCMVQTNNLKTPF